MTPQLPALFLFILKSSSVPADIKTAMVRINARTEPLSIRLRKVPAKRAERASIPPSPRTDTLVAVHLDPDYLGIEKCVGRIKHLMDQVKFDHTFQLLTASGYTFMLDYGNKMRYWPPGGAFMQNPPGDTFTLVGGYFQYCMRDMFKGLIETLGSSRARGDRIYINFPLEAIFAAELAYEDGETLAYPIPAAWEKLTREQLIPFLNSKGIAYRIYFAERGVKYEVLGTPKPQKTIQASITFWADLKEYIAELKRQN